MGPNGLIHPAQPSPRRGIKGPVILYEMSIRVASLKGI
jgi:hypothetical protein